MVTVTGEFILDEMSTFASSFVTSPSHMHISASINVLVTCGGDNCPTPILYLSSGANLLAGDDVIDRSVSELECFSESVENDLFEGIPFRDRYIFKIDSQFLRQPLDCARCSSNSVRCVGQISHNQGFPQPLNFNMGIPCQSRDTRFDAITVNYSIAFHAEADVACERIDPLLSAHAPFRSCTQHHDFVLRSSSKNSLNPISNPCSFAWISNFAPGSPGNDDGFTFLSGSDSSIMETDEEENRSEPGDPNCYQHFNEFSCLAHAPSCSVINRTHYETKPACRQM